MKESLGKVSCLIGGLMLIMTLIGHAEIFINHDETNGNIEITSEGGVSRVGQVTGCVEGSGIKQSDIRAISAFSEISIDGIFEVMIDFQNSPSLIITGDDNILPYVRTEVQGQTLTIQATESICPKRNLVVQVSTKYLDHLKADGATNITISKMNNQEFSALVNGAGDLRVSGETRKFSAKVNGTGNILAKNLHAEETIVLIDGAGEAVVHASKRLIAEIDGAGDIRYYGNPSEVTKKIDGVGEIEPQ